MGRLAKQLGVDGLAVFRETLSGVRVGLVEGGRKRCSFKRRARERQREGFDGDGMMVDDGEPI